MQRKAIAALMISLLLLSACGHGAGEQTFEAFRDTLTGKLVTVTAQVRVQRGDTVTDYTLTCQELPDGYDLTVTAPEQAAGVTAHLRDGASALAFDDIILPAGDLNGAGLTPLTALPYVVQAIRSGYVGAIAILILFALLICRGYWIAAHSPDRYSFLVGIGITTLLSIQVFLNIAVVTNLIPCTGISLPFFSYGGTALLMQLGEMGIILSISRDIPTKKAR